MPTYFDMAKDAIMNLKDRTGSSVQAIKGYIEANYQVEFKPHLLRAALKRGVESGKFIKVKASYKLSPAEKKPAPKKKVVAPKKKVAAAPKKKATPKKKAAPKKKASVKKSPAKKKTAGKKKAAAKK